MPRIKKDKSDFSSLRLTLSTESVAKIAYHSKKNKLTMSELVEFWVSNNKDFATWADQAGKSKKSGATRTNAKRINSIMDESPNGYNEKSTSGDLDFSLNSNMVNS